MAIAAALILPAAPALADDSPEPTPTTTVSPTSEPSDPVTDPPSSEPTDPPTDPPADPSDPPTSMPTGIFVGGQDNTLPVKPGTKNGIYFGLQGQTGPVQATVSWWLEGRADTEPAVAYSGTLEEADHTYYYPITVPSVPDGIYRVFVRVAIDGGPTLEGSTDGAGAGMLVDGTAPTVGLTSSYGTFFPYPDGYRDKTTITLTSDEGSHYSLTLWQGSKKLRTLGAMAEPYFKGSKTFTWDGTVGGKRVCGTFTLKARVADGVENLTEKNLTVVTSSKRLQWRTWTSSARAWDRVIGTDVGRCSQVTHPARRGWPHSIAYRSLNRCGTRSEGYATTTARAYLPASVNGRFRNLHVDAYGGRPVGWRGDVYMVSGYFNTKGDFVRRHEAGSSTPWKNQGTVADPATLVWSASSSKPYFYWGNGLDDRARYDIRWFRVSVDYRVLA